MARAALDWTVAELSAAAGVGQTTIVRFEREQVAANKSTVAAIEHALEAAGVRFLPGDEPGVKLVGPHRAATQAGIAGLPTHDLPWDGSISLHREDMYGDDGR
jgi:transcriptional regulator with XRE-family HTH domain